MNKITLITIAAGTVLLSTGFAHALTSPFVSQSLQQGYMVADASTKAADSKCGASMDKASNAKCGAKMNATPATPPAATAPAKKMKDGKCGEGKCGANKGKK
ncbi:MAG: low-complexity protein [Sulfuriferula sp.]|nr:low-complexity protein [Sulfuriferula sp.]